MFTVVILTVKMTVRNYEREESLYEICTNIASNGKPS